MLFPWQTGELGIAFFGLTRLREWHSASEDLRVAEFLQSYYVLAERTIAGAGARLVKLNGAEGLCVIPTPRMAAGVHALRARCRRPPTPANTASRPI